MLNKPLGVAVPRRKEDGLGGGMIAVIVLSSVTALIICMSIAWLLLLKFGNCVRQPQKIIQPSVGPPSKPSGTSTMTTLLVII